MRAFHHYTTLVITVALILYDGIVLAQPEDKDPYLKAAYIYNFTRYIRWEAGCKEAEFIIGEMGYSELDSALGSITRNNLVNNRRIVLRHFSRPEEIGCSHILFIPATCQYSLQSILGRLGKGVLTIGERKGCAREGVALNFVLVDRKLRFEANERVMNKMGLKVSSQLLKLAIIVH